MTILQTWPEHQNPTRRDRVASAPYNFVPLPEKIIPAVDSIGDLPDHNKYYRDRLSGYFDVTLTTRSPLYIRGPLPAKDLSRQEELKDKPEFFYTRNEHTPVIPGSSLRGMLRSVLEIASYSKMQWVSEKQLFFRTVDNTAIGKYYRARMGDHVETGFLTRRGDKYYIKVCSMARVRRSEIGNPIYSGTRPNEIPRWQGQPRQYAPVWVRIRTGTANRPNIVEDLSYQKRDGMVQGRLVITGNMSRKRKEFVFLLPAASAEEIPVSDDIISRFHDDDQLTQWQEEAFPANQPTPGYRERDGMLGNAPAAPGDPIFFLRENGKLTFIGRARMFRLPYTRSPFDLVDQSLHSAGHIDYAEALFGFVRTPLELKELGANAPRQGEKGRAYAGRVTVTDAVLQPDQESIWLAGDFNKEITPKILATPKPTAFQHYLTQQQPDDPRRLDHYDSRPPESDETTIRGHKLYWHQGLETDQGLPLEDIHDAIKEPAKVGPGDTQHTRFKPLKPGVQFTFRVYFENLSERELGALCWTLHPNGEQSRRYCHHLGMGKPLGMGAVELHAHLHIIDRPLRYNTLFTDSGDNWQLGEVSTVEDLATREILERRTRPFEEHLLDELNPEPACGRLADMLRIAMLLKLLEWPGYRADEDGPTYLENQRPPRPNTRYMKIQPYNEYRERPVLPNPRRFDESYFKGKSRPKVPRAVILTALKVEYEAVRTHLSKIREEVYKGTVYERGVFFPGNGNQSWDVGIAQIGAGNVGAAFETERAIDYLKPDIILFIGVTSGIKDVKIGDVVVATKVYEYELDRASNTFRTKSDVGQSSYRLIQRAQAEARKTDWLQRIEEAFPTTPVVFVGPIAAGEKLIASTHFAIGEFLQRTYGDSLALEMEGSGFLAAINTNEQAQTLVIRGISDLIDHPRSNVQNSQEIAARHASAFAFEILSKMDLPQELLLWRSLVSLISSQKQSIPLRVLEKITQLFISSLLGTEPDESVLPTDWTSFFWTKLDIKALFKNILLPPQIPMIFFTAPLFDEGDAKVLREMMQKIAPQTKLALLCLFIETTKHVNEALQILENTLRNAYAYNIVPLLYKDFLEIVEATDPQEAFRQILLSRINLETISPFITTGPTPDFMFFGREHELHTISTHAHNASYALIGGRRIGKTSIMRRLWRISLPEAGIRAFYQDCSFIQTPAQLIQAISLSWFPKFSSLNLSTFAEVVRALPDDKSLVFLFDEADKLIEPDKAAGYPLLNMLRALANAGRCQFVFSGEYALRSDMQNPRSPLYNFANELLIGQLDARAVRELIVQPMHDLEIALEDEDKIVGRIWEFTAGHPNVIQRLCKHLVKEINGSKRLRLGINDVEEILTNTNFLRHDFLETYWGQATLLERLCTLVMAKRRDTQTLIEIHAALVELDPGLTLDEVNEALERLINLRNLLRRTTQGYVFVVKDFPVAIAKTYVLDDLIALTSDKYKRENA